MDAYEVLGVREDADTDELRRAYQQLARQYHPDRARPSGEASTADDANDAFRRVQDAWELVRDPDGRRRYDAERRAEALQDLGSRATEVDLGEMDYAEDDAGAGVWRYDCRCGDAFVVTEEQLTDGIDTIACRSCSLLLRPLYQRAAEQ